jgi:hypothetical protein
MRHRTPRTGIARLVSSSMLAGVVAGAAARAATDPVAAEIARWTSFVQSHTADDELWKQVQESSQTTLAGADEALRAGRRLLALQRLAFARADLLAATYMSERPPEQRKDDAAFAAEWTRMGTVLRADLAPPRADALAGLQPAALRALAEAALPQVRTFYDASLEYGRNTMPDSGLYYLGSAQAQRDFVAFARTLHEKTAAAPPPLRALAPELDALQKDLLAAYRPPASIDAHPQFIRASALLKEARELDAAGLRYGALQRYLMAAYRFAPLRAQPPAREPAATEAALASFEARLRAPGVDHSLGRFFLEIGRSEAASPAGAANAAAIATEVLPRYFRALEPAAPAKPAPPADLKVTLVRWPYT